MNPTTDEKGRFLQLPLSIIYGHPLLNRDDKWVLVAIMGKHWTDGPHQLSYRQISALSGVPISLLSSIKGKNGKPDKEGIMDRIQRVTGWLKFTLGKELDPNTGLPKGNAKTYVTIDYKKMWEENAAFCRDQKPVSYTNRFEEQAAPMNEPVSITNNLVPIENTPVSHTNGSVPNTNKPVSFSSTKYPPNITEDSNKILQITEENEEGVSSVVAMTSPSEVSSHIHSSVNSVVSSDPDDETEGQNRTGNSTNVNPEFFAQSTDAQPLLPDPGQDTQSFPTIKPEKLETQNPGYQPVEPSPSARNDTPDPDSAKNSALIFASDPASTNVVQLANKNVASAHPGDEDDPGKPDNRRNAPMDGANGCTYDPDEYPPGGPPNRITAESLIAIPDHTMQYIHDDTKVAKSAVNEVEDYTKASEIANKATADTNGSTEQKETQGQAGETAIAEVTGEQGLFPSPVDGSSTRTDATGQNLGQSAPDGQKSGNRTRPSRNAKNTAKTVVVLSPDEQRVHDFYCHLWFVKVPPKINETLKQHWASLASVIHTQEDMDGLYKCTRKECSFLKSPVVHPGNLVNCVNTWLQTRPAQPVQQALPVTKPVGAMNEDQACTLARKAVLQAQEQEQEIGAAAVLKNAKWLVIIEWKTPGFTRPEEMTNEEQWNAAFSEMCTLWNISKKKERIAI